MVLFRPCFFEVIGTGGKALTLGTLKRFNKSNGVIALVIACTKVITHWPLNTKQNQRNEENKTETTALSKPNIREPNYLYHWSSPKGNSGSQMLASLRKKTWHFKLAKARKTLDIISLWEKPNKLFSGGLLWLNEWNQTSFSKEACCDCAVTDWEKPNKLFSGGLLCLCCDQVRKIKQAF